MGDARFNGIILEYFYRWLGGHEQSLTSPGFFYPMPGALTFSDNHWGSAWIYSLFRAVGADQYRAFDLWYLTAYALNYLAAHLFLRRMHFSPVASALGAFVFASRLPYSQLMYRCMLPVALLAWQRFREEGRPLWVGRCHVLPRRGGGGGLADVSLHLLLQAIPLPARAAFWGCRLRLTAAVVHDRFSLCAGRRTLVAAAQFYAERLRGLARVARDRVYPMSSVERV
ncbi:hypothetical protein NB693_21265 [Pantoea ananatis]|uniref:hypothetical protein n=1 Tax=Pantoea ananas TaxID=553 RepID=UPI00221FB772|nr:hypothetical protein [Pantoea ananatis]